MNKIGVVGALGRTGRHVVEALSSSSTSELHEALVSPGSPMVGTCVGESEVVYSSDLACLSGCDGVIDFSNPATTAKVAGVCATLKKPLLVATTGLGEEELNAIGECAKVAPVCIAPNTSLGATALAMAARYLQKVLGDSFDIEVMEIHHRMKKDAPSGTARAVVSNLTGADTRVVFGREGLRAAGEIGVVSLRGGDVPGDHTVYFLGEGERLEVTHRSQTRAIFGRGAVVLMERLLARRAGLYTVEQLLVGD
jgi:4-hydroxy-tetrahydrodipicolinate reductase